MCDRGEQRSQGRVGFFFFSFVLFIKGYKRSSTQYQEVASNSYGITITISRSSLRVLRISPLSTQVAAAGRYVSAGRRLLLPASGVLCALHASASSHNVPPTACPVPPWRGTSPAPSTFYPSAPPPPPLQEKKNMPRSRSVLS